MRQRRIRKWILPVLLTVGAGLRAGADDALDAWIPAAAVAVLEVAKPDPVIDRVFEAVRAAQDAGGAERTGRQAGDWAKFEQFLDAKLQTTGEALLRRIVSGGAVLAVGPGGSFVAVARSGDEPFLRKINDAIVAAARMGATQKGAPDPVTEGIHQGVPYWSIGGKEYHAIDGDRLILANQLPALKAVLDTRAGAPGVAKAPAYQAAHHTVDPASAARLTVSPALLQFLRGRKKAPDASPNAMVELLLGCYREALGGGDWLAAGLSMQGRTLALHVAANGAPPARDAPTAFAWPPDAADGALAAAPIPGQIASASLYRDLRGFYAAKDALFPERTSQLIFFENMMGIYFSGRDLTDDVLGAVGPHVRLVIAEPVFDPAVGTPAVRIPAFALVFRMREPARFAAVIEEAWQKALGMVNFSRGQKALPGLIIDRFEHAGIRYSCASFSAAEEKDRTRLDTRFNFRPAIAYAGETLVLSSTGSLAESLLTSA